MSPNTKISMTKGKFDLSMAFDKVEYINPQLYMLTNTLKNNLPEDTILHIVTNREEDDETLQYIQKNIPTKIYHKQPFENLKSRCQYMFHCFEVETDKPWLIKIEADILALRNLRVFNKTLNDAEVILQPENRRIITDDLLEERVWRNIYRAMKIKLPDIKFKHIENGELGRPLVNTGVVCVRSEHLDYINKRWIELIKIAEKWIDFGIHPNEFAFTAMLFESGWDFKFFNERYNFNPIGHYRKGLFPSTDLIDNCRLSSDIVLLHYHRPKWLFHLARYNKNISDIVERNLENIPVKWWDLNNELFIERN